MPRRKEVTTICLDKDVYDLIDEGKKEFLEETGVQLSTSGFIAYLVRKNAKVD